MTDAEKRMARITSTLVVLVVMLIIGGMTLIGVVVLRNQQKATADVLDRVDRNAEVSQRALNAIICVLQPVKDSPSPEEITDHIGDCLEMYGFPRTAAA